MSSNDRERSLSFKPRFNRDGLLPCIVQDDATNQVLMFAWMNAEALQCSLSTSKATYYSRSRKKLWIKGETSGHTQEVVSLTVDCDQDVLLMRVKQVSAACHLGYRSCFFRTVGADRQTLTINQEPIAVPHDSP